jgi:hypothetical protein
MRFKNSAVGFLFLALAAAGQGQNGTITGAVTDPDSKPIAGAQVQAKNERGAQFQAKTSANGSYSLAQLPAGTYSVAIMSPGLLPFSKEQVAVKAGQGARVDAKLQDFYSLGTVGEDRAFYADIFDQHKAPSGPTPRTADGKPDFSGVWHTLRFVDPGAPELLPWAEKVTQERVANNFKDFPGGHCLPFGITMAAIVLPFRIMQNKTVMALLYEDDLPRQIYLDGRKHPDESLSPFVGHSVGKFEGDTLVVDTVGFNDKTWVDLDGHPHTDKMHITERYRRKDMGHLELEMTIDDPGAYKKPWTIKKASELAGEKEEVGQYVCTENNRDEKHLVGK